MAQSSDNTHDPASQRARLEPKPSPDRPHRQSDPQRARAFAVEVARLLSDDKCEEVVVLDVQGLSTVTDLLVIATGTSGRQMASAVQHVEDLGERMGFAAFGKSADDASDWILCDFVDVVVHVFEPNVRAHYDLEMMWGDARNVDWSRTGKTRP